MRSLPMITALTAAAALFVSAPAFAHPKLLSSTPAANSQVAVPQQITLTFNEALNGQFSGLDIVMNGMPGMPNHKMKITGAKVTTGPDGKTLVAVLPRPLMAGNYQVAWHVVSADTHRIEGNFSFKVK